MRGKGVVKKSDYVFLSWGAEVTVTHLGIWGHRANTFRYRFSGAKGKYPDTVYRFTRFGDGSIAADRFSDIEIPAEKLRVGHYLGMDIDEVREGTEA